MKEFTIGPNDAGQRLDRFLAKAVPLLPASLAQKYIRLKRIKCNGKRIDRDTRLNAGDVLQMYINDEFFDKPREDNAYLTVASPKLNIVYEDENILLVDKRPGLAVHPHDGAEYGRTLIDHIQSYLYQKREWRPREENAFTPALCNRIDRNTGGMVIAAKNAAALRDMNERIREGEISKFYLAAVHGKMEKREATLCAYLRKDSAKNQVTVHDTPFPGAKKILTRYRVLAEKNGRSLLEVELLTGRTHQIRAHLSHIGHPLLGDGKYGHNEDDRKMGYKYQALYAYRLRMDFSQKGGVLDYLRGREFRIPREDVWFLRDFDGART